MNDCKKSNLLFDEFFLNEISIEDKKFIDEHLKTCLKCSSELKENTAMLSGITINEYKEPRQEFWDNYLTNLNDRMQSEGLLQEDKLLNKSDKIKKIIYKISNWFKSISASRWALQGSAVIVLLLIGVLIGRNYFAPVIPSTNEKSQFEKNILIANNPGPKQAILQRTSNFIDRSRVILLAIDNFDLEKEDSEVINLFNQQRVSRNLVKQAALIKEDLSNFKQHRLKALIGDLEIILLQIANIDSGSEMETIKLVKGNKYIHGMLYRIRINDLRRSVNKKEKFKTI